MKPSRKPPHRLLATWILLLALFSGCQWSQIPVKSSAYVSEEIHFGDIAQILQSVEKLMTDHGYDVFKPEDPQEPAFLPAHPGSLGNRTLTFLHGGQDRIRIIANPTGSGWKLYCIPEPDGYDTSFNARLCRRILTQVRSQYENRP